jgi:hypothetical protein
MSIVNLLFLTVVVFWLVVTVGNQFPRFRAVQRLKRWDVGSLLPLWTFFAPRPGVTDQVLLYRDCSPRGELGPWRTALTYGSKPARAFWNPDKRVQKLVSDCAGNLLASPFLSDPAIVLDLPYLVLQRVVEVSRHEFGAARCQFAVVELSDFRGRPSSRMLFRSALFKLEGPR